MKDSKEPRATKAASVDRIVMRLRSHANHKKHDCKYTASILNEAADVLDSLVLIRSKPANDRFDEGCELRKYRELADSIKPA